MDYLLDHEEVLSKHQTTSQGLGHEEAARRLKEHGPNKLAEPKKKPVIIKFFSHFTDVMVLVLIGAALLSIVIGIIEHSTEEMIDAAIILLIVLINAIIGFIQENKAEEALAALKSMSVAYSKVMRQGEVMKIKAEELVVGDLVLLEAGDIVPADLRLLESAGLQIQEAALTGESVPVEKRTAAIAHEVPLGDRLNMAYSSSVLLYGRGKGIVVATGMATEVGKIAALLETPEEATPLQKKLNKTGQIISLFVLLIAVLIFIATIISNHPVPEGTNKYAEAFMTAIAIAVAAIPEGLPAVITIVMALGVTRLSRRHAIIRKLPAVETLGCTQVICSDKTGTLTLNKMTIQEVVTLNNQKAEQAQLITCMVLCNDSTINDGQVLGDPTETALIDYALMHDINKNELEEKYPRINEKPFDSDRKLMTTVHQVANQTVAYTKGAFDELIAKCNRILDGDNIRELTDQDKQFFIKKNQQLALSALRVLGYSYHPQGAIETEMVFLGLSGMIDPPRPEAAAAIKVCRQAGMRPIMITGDHRDTALAIGQQLGLIDDESGVITGRELDLISDEDYLKNIEKYRIYARVSPQNKVRIVQAWRSRGQVVAMTGDGVNDAPSLKQADIGIGMGITGTDVTKSIADMVLADDNFATIVIAVEEGRKIYNNIEKAIQYLLSANIAEVFSLFLVTLFFPQLIFLAAVQILWINLVTDSFSALALGVEKSDDDIMSLPPRAQESSLFKGRKGVSIIWKGVAQGLLVVAVFLLGNHLYDNAVATTLAFATLCLIQLFHSFNCRTKKSLFLTNPFSNLYLLASFLIGLVLTVLVVALPLANPILRTTPLTWTQWGLALLFAFAIIPLVEIGKGLEHFFHRHKQ